MAAADADLAPRVVDVRMGDIADKNDLGRRVGAVKGGGGGGCRVQCALQMRTSTCTRTCWRGVPA